MKQQSHFLIHVMIATTIMLLVLLGITASTQAPLRPDWSPSQHFALSTPGAGSDFDLLMGHLATLGLAERGAVVHLGCSHLRTDLRDFERCHAVARQFIVEHGLTIRIASSTIRQQYEVWSRGKLQRIDDYTVTTTQTSILPRWHPVPNITGRSSAECNEA